MLVTIHSSRLIGGSITAPPSKSMAHRAVLCAALATGSSHITNLEFSKDISATLAAAGQLCARVTTGPADAVVEGLGRFAPLTAPVDCCESGSTLRFLILRVSRNCEIIHRKCEKLFKMKKGQKLRERLLIKLDFMRFSLYN